MGHPALMPRSLSYAEYLLAEETSAEKHEFYEGEIFNMAGGSLDHAFLIAAVSRVFGNRLLRKPCSVFSSDLRLRYPGVDAAAYPDAMIVCGRQEIADDDPHAVTNPTVIVEVLSPSTESWDRTGKFANATRIAALRHYLLVAQDEVRVEHLARNADGSWSWSEHRAGDVVRLGELCELPVDELYDGLEEDRARRA